MSPGTFDLLLYRGDTCTWTFYFWNDPAETAPFDLTGATVAAEIRDRPSGSQIVVLDCEITLPNVIDVTFPDDQWTNVPVTGVWDLQLTFPDKIRTMVAGKTTVTPDVTGSDVTASTLVAVPGAVRTRRVS